MRKKQPRPVPYLPMHELCVQDGKKVQPMGEKASVPREISLAGSHRLNQEPSTSPAFTAGDAQIDVLQFPPRWLPLVGGVVPIRL